MGGETLGEKNTPKNNNSNLPRISREFPRRFGRRSCEWDLGTIADSNMAADFINHLRCKNYFFPPNP